MAEQDAQRHIDIQESSRSVAARYGFALVATAAGLAITLALSESGLVEQPIYAPLIGAAALSAWFGGFGPAAVSIVLAWGMALALVVPPQGEMSFGDTDDATRWWVNLVVAIVIGAAGSMLRLRQERASDELVTTRASIGEIESLQRLSVALSSALSPSDVACALTPHAQAIVGAQGAALGSVQGDSFVIAEATGIAASVESRGEHFDLEEGSMLAAAARGNAIARAMQRATLEAAFPVTAQLVPPTVRSAFAVPIRAGDGTVTGSLAFLFDREGGPTAEAEGLARVVADLAGQSLERARLYELERESRRALDRILEVAPRFHVDSGSVVESVCREARATFGADYGSLWRIVDDARLELLHMDPPQPALTGTVALELDDFPRLREAIESLRTSFVPDVLETSYAAGRDFVQRLGIRSSLRTPIVIAGRSELVLSISWQSVVSEPDQATLAVVRRFADQAGLALEQLERRRAEAEALARADDTRRLQEVTAALSKAATHVDVSTTCLSHALEAIGAEAGFVVLTAPDGSRTVELVASDGYEEDELEAWRGFGLDDDLPFSRAIGSGESVWALEPADLEAFAFSERRTTGWFAIPLVTSRGARGALHVSLRDGRTVTPTQRRWLEAMVAQCGQALERSGLYEDEQRSRLRAERLQTITAELSNALTSTDVASVVVDAIVAAFAPAAVALAPVGNGKPSAVLTAFGDGEEILARLAGLEDGTAAGLAVRARRSVLVPDAASMRNAFPDVAEAMAAFGHETLLLVPLVAARRVNGLLVVAWACADALAQEDRAVVEALAGQAALALDRAGRYESEQAIAETLQRSVLPDSLPRVHGVQLAARYLPGSTELDVGGDWFDAVTLPDGKLALVVGDVVGKGVEAAASMAQLRNAIRAFSIEPLRPSSALARLNRLSADVLDTSFATLVYASIDPSTGVCRISSAGHPPPVVAYPDGRVELVEGGRGLPLGTGLRTRYRQHTLELPAGSVMLLYTDGLVERRGASIDEGLAALCDAMARAPTDPDRLLEHVLETVVGEREREDDIALLAVRMLPVAPIRLDLRVPSDVDSMSTVRDALRVWLAGTPLERSEAEGLVLATWEALANAVEHAIDPSERTVRVRAGLEDSTVRVVVDDFGAWRPESSRSSRDDRGFGLTLMQALVSSMRVDRRESGTTIVLEKALGTDGRGAVLQQPDEQQDDDDERQQSTTDVHGVLPS